MLEKKSVLEDEAGVTQDLEQPRELLPARSVITQAQTHHGLLENRDLRSVPTVGGTVGKGKHCPCLKPKPATRGREWAP